MEMKYVLYSIVHRKEASGEFWTFKYKPTLEPYQKHCTFSVTTEDPFDTMGKLGLPQGIGDVIIMDFKPKNVQGTLKSGDKKAVD